MREKILFKILQWFFYLMGVFLIGSFAHEIYHWSICGGEFYAGLNYFDGEFNPALTICSINNSAGTEIIPTTIEVLFYILMITLKIKMEKKNV